MSMNISSNTKKKIIDIAKFAFLIVVLFLLFLLVENILFTTDLGAIDVSKNAHFTITDSTKEKLKNIDKEVDIYIVNVNTETTVERLLKSYNKENSNIRFKRIPNITDDPELAIKFNMDNSTTQLLAVVCGDNMKFIDSSSLSFTNYNMETGVALSEDRSEETITNAILAVYSDAKPKIRLFMDHRGDTDLVTEYGSFLADLYNNMYDIDSISIQSSDEDPDADVILMMGITEDITTYEKVVLENFLEHGGDLFICQSMVDVEENYPNFESLISKYGLSFDKGIIYEESSANAYNYPIYIVEDITKNITTKGEDLNLKACLAAATPIALSEREGVTHEILAQTSDLAFLRKALVFDAEGKEYKYHTDQDSDYNNFIVGAIATKKIDEGVESNIIMYSSIEMLENLEFQLTNGTDVKTYDFCNLFHNREIGVNAVNYLSGRMENISVRKSYEYIKYYLTDEEDQSIIKVLYGIPVMIIAVGAIVQFARKRSK